MYNWYDPNDLYLMHYGVKGMKWGHRKRQLLIGNNNTRRFPTKDGDGFYNKNRVPRDAKTGPIKTSRKTDYEMISEAVSGVKKVGKAVGSVVKKINKKSEKAQTDTNTKKEARNTPEAVAARKAKIKKTAKIGATVAGTVLAAYGAKKVYDYTKNKKNTDAGMKWAKDSGLLGTMGDSVINRASVNYTPINRAKINRIYMK